MFRIELIGVQGERLDAEARALLADCVLAAHSARQAPMLAGLDIGRAPVAPLEALWPALEAGLSRGNVAVLASGDPLFFGIGRRLVERFGADRLRVRPALSSLQLAASRFKIPWNDLPVLSLHGRTAAGAAARILRCERVFCLTDPENSPDALARMLIDRLAACGADELLAGMRMRVAENLGLADERLVAGTLEEMAAQRFAPLNVVLIEQAAPPPALRFGLNEAEIRHSRGLITKDEVRAAALHSLRLPERGVFWDIGGGSGSVSLEAAALAPELDIRIVERQPEEQENIKANIRRFGAWGIRPHFGEAPAILRDLPPPDRVFVGGSGGKLREILAAAAAVLAPGGRIVVNAVLEASRDEAVHTLAGLGFRVRCSELAVTRHEAAGGPTDRTNQQNPKKFNPITIVTGYRDEQ